MELDILANIGVWRGAPYTNNRGLVCRNIILSACSDDNNSATAQQNAQELPNEVISAIVNQVISSRGSPEPGIDEIGCAISYADVRRM